jgi:Ca-activated chloride channel family protein
MANLGAQDAESIIAAVAEYRQQGIACNSFGFGLGNYNDNILEQMANRGDGYYAYIDTAKETRRVFTEELGSRLNVIARDAKIQVQFDPRRVRRYRLIGYENRDIADKDFRNDAVDAGEVGSGKSATALYELELHGTDDPHRAAMDFGTVFVRYENVATGKVEEISTRLARSCYRERTPENSPRFFLAACAAEFAEILRGSEHAQGGSLAGLTHYLDRVAAELPLDERVQELRQLVHRSRGLPRAQ